VLHREVGALVAAVEAHAPVALAQPAAGEELDALAVGRKARVTARVGDEPRLASLRLDDVEAGVNAVERAAEAVAALALVDDAAAVGREAGRAVVAGPVHEHAALAGAEVERADAAVVLVAEGGVDERAAVGRERRLILE